MTAFANAYAERFVRTVKENCLEQMIFFGEDSLRNGIREFIAHYHGEEIIKAWEIGISLQSNGSTQKQEQSDGDNGSAEGSTITIETRREGTDMPESNIWILRD